MTLNDIILFMTEAGADGVDFSISKVTKSLVVRPYKNLAPPGETPNLFYMPQHIGLETICAAKEGDMKAELEIIRAKFLEAVKQRLKEMREEEGRRGPTKRRNGFLGGGRITPDSFGI